MFKSCSGRWKKYFTSPSSCDLASDLGVCGKSEWLLLLAAIIISCFFCLFVCCCLLLLFQYITLSDLISIRGLILKRHKNRILTMYLSNLETLVQLDGEMFDGATSRRRNLGRASVFRSRTRSHRRNLTRDAQPGPSLTLIKKDIYNFCVSLSKVIILYNIDE